MMAILAVVIWAWLVFYVLFEGTAVAKDAIVRKVKNRRKNK